VVVFRFGQVIRATSSTIKYFLGEELLKRKVVDQECLDKALQAQQAGAYRERLGTILIHRFNIPAQNIETVVREQIEKVVYSFFSWDEGRFEFEMQDDVETIDDSRIDPLQFMLEQGLNPQFLALEGSRIIDEKRQKGDLLDDDYLLHQEPAVAVTEPAAAPFVPQEPDPAMSTSSFRDVVIVENEQFVRELLTENITRAGASAFAFARSEDALITIDTLYRDGNRLSIVIDLIMPRMDGSGILGGLELLELVNNNFPDLPVLVISDYRNSDAERRIREARANFLLKPRKSELSEAKAAERFCASVMTSLDSVTSGIMLEHPVDDVNLGDELRLELGEIGYETYSTVVPSTGISQLRGMLEELHDPALGGGVILLLLRFASEFMGRAVIFLVKDRNIVGIGQFGIETKDLSADRMIRSLKIPVDEESIFSPVIKGRIPVKVTPDKNPWNDYLFGRIGGIPEEVFLGPLISEGDIVAILYGDNVPDGKPIGDTDSLEIFLSQAGVAMEKGLLAQRLINKNKEGA
jgi:CheY-like chemotaxis protein